MAKIEIPELPLETEVQAPPTEEVIDESGGASDLEYIPICVHRKVLSEETKRKMSLVRKGKKKSESHRFALSEALKGKSKTADHRRKLSLALMGNVPWNKNPDRHEQKRKEKIGFVYHQLLHRLYRDMRLKKEGHSYEQLGYKVDDFRRHIESLFCAGMTWDNHGIGLGKWHVDHVRPISSFEEGTPASVVNALSNLQPLWQEENLSKGAKYAG
jgi:hypothetical protein